MLRTRRARTVIDYKGIEQKLSSVKSVKYVANVSDSENYLELDWENRFGVPVKFYIETWGKEAGSLKLVLDAVSDEAVDTFFKVLPQIGDIGLKIASIDLHHSYYTQREKFERLKEEFLSSK